MTSTWWAGCATTQFPVPIGTELGGYADRDGFSTGTHDPLEISALVLQCGDEHLCLITSDLVGVDAALRDELAIAAGMPPADLIIAASHTHSGPLGVAGRLHPASASTLDATLRQRWLKETVSVLAEALAHRQPARLDHGTVHLDGVWSHRNDPALPGDARVRWLRVSSPDDSPMALLMLVPCHPTVLGSWNREVSADLHGGIRRALRPHLPQGCTLLTITGAAGDISTRFTRSESSFGEVDRLGTIVADAVFQSLPHGTPLPPQMGPARETTLALPVRHLDREQVRATVIAAETAWRISEATPTLEHAERRRIFTELQGARIQQGMAALPPIPATITGRVLGETLGLVTVPGELFSSAGRALEAQAPTSDTWVIGYANGYVGYLADRHAHDSATYEALASPYAAETTELVVAAGAALLASLNGKP